MSNLGKSPHILFSLFSKLDRRSLVLLGVNIFVAFVAGYAEIKTINSLVPAISVLKNANESQSQIISKSSVFLFYILLVTFLRFLLSWIRTIGTARIMNDINLKCYTSLINMSYREKFNISQSNLVALLVSHIEATSGIINAFIQIVTSLLSTLAIIYAIVNYNLINSIFCIIGVGSFYFIIALFTKKPLGVISRNIAESMDLQSQLSKETKSGFRIIEIDNLKQLYINWYRKNDFRLRNNVAYQQLIATLPRNLIEGIALIVVFIGSVAFNNDNRIETIGVIGLASQRLLPLIQLSYSGWVSIQGSIVSASKVNSILNTKNTSSTLKTKSVNTIKSICLHKCNFNYDNNNIILKDVNIKVNSSEKVLIRGESGAGKTTFMDLLLGFSRPTKGEYILNDYSLKESEKVPYEKIAFAPQNVFIRPGTVSENIVLDQNNIDNNKLDRVIKIAKIDNFVTNSSIDISQLNISEGGESLSGGQKQRIGIARALYKQADFIFLDECTSAIDKNLEKEIFTGIINNLDGAGLIVISHSKDINEYFDRIFEVQNNTVREVYL